MPTDLRVSPPINPSMEKNKDDTPGASGCESLSDFGVKARRPNPRAPAACLNQVARLLATLRRRDRPEKDATGEGDGFADDAEALAVFVRPRGPDGGPDRGGPVALH